MASLWDYDDAINDYVARAWEMDEDAPGTGIEVPPWIEQGISPSDVAAIVHGGCASGAYMPACTYRQAAETMNDHGDEVMQYLEDNDFAAMIDPAKIMELSWSGLACHFLSAAVELWAAAVEDELGEMIDAIEEGGDEEGGDEEGGEGGDGQPAEGDFTVSPCGPLGSRLAVGIVDGGSRGFVGEFPDEDSAIAAIRERMDAERYWPDIWSVSDHGNAERIDINAGRGDGEDGR